VEETLKSGCKSIAYTYNDPIVFYEYVEDTAKLAKAKGIKNVIVSNGFINKDPLERWCEYIDAANIDLKGFDDKFYREMTLAWLDPVLESLKLLKKKGVWLEITNLIIPTKNDDMKMIRKMCKWIRDNLGTKVPLHFTAFYPCYKLMDVPPTPIETLKEAKEVALKAGLEYVYLGNVPEASNTDCPKCGNALVSRIGYSIATDFDGTCRCGQKIEGVWS
jgi:pyruvate formate lyase activating enzyme